MKKSLKKSLVIWCSCAAAFTIIFLTVISLMARHNASLTVRQPDYERYLKQGYDFDSVSNKYSLLFCIYDDSELLKTHIICADTDKHTIDILDIPPQSQISCDGFTDTLNRAYKAPVFDSIVKRILLLDIDGYAYIHLSDFLIAMDLLDIGCDKSDLYRNSLPERLFERFYQLGTVEVATRLIGVLVNELDTNLDADGMIELLSIIGRAKPADIKAHTLPGKDGSIDGERAFLPDPVKAAELLNDNFRVKGSMVSADRLGFVSNPPDNFD